MRSVFECVFRGYRPRSGELEVPRVLFLLNACGSIFHWRTVALVKRAFGASKGQQIDVILNDEQY